MEFSRALRRKDGRLFCEQVDIAALQAELTETFRCKDYIGDSPFFVYSKQQIVDNVRTYSAALQTIGVPSTIGFSLKANYNPHILRLVTSAAPNVAVVTVSGHEVRHATSTGVSPERIIFNGNGKQPWELRLAVSLGCLVNVDSLFDVRRLLRVCEESVADNDERVAAGRRRQRPAVVRVLLRLNPDIDAEVHPFLATGLAKSKFGIDDSQLDEVLNVIKEHQSLLQLVGLHCHLGSTIDNTFVFSECLEVMLNVAQKLRSQGFTDLQYINLGGGLGIDYQQHASRTKPPPCSSRSAEELAEKLNEFCDAVDRSFLKRNSSSANRIRQLIQQISNSSGSDADNILIREICTHLLGYTTLLRSLQTIFPDARIQVAMPSPADLVNVIRDRLQAAAVDWPSLSLIVEPGRSIVGNAGTFITRVLGWKRNGNRRYIVVDGSMTEVIRPALYGAYHHIELTEPTADESNKDVFDVVGPVCECGDFLGKDRWLPYPHEGCGLAVFDTGAYCASMASNYNMRSRPLEILVDGNEWKIIRHPETLDDIVHTFQSGLKV